MAVGFALPVLPLWLVLVNFWSNFANANLSVHPTDTVVLVNHSTYFNCSTSARNIGANYVLWYHYPLNSAQRNDVYDEGYIMYEYKDRFSIETALSAGVFNLVVERPSLADAGKYECQDGVGQGDKASAELIVLDGNPSCESNMNPEEVIGQNDCGLKPDEVQLTCNVTSSYGNIPPTLEWKISGDKSSSSLVLCERSTSCSLTLKGNLSFNSQYLVCQTTEATRQQYGCSVGPIEDKCPVSAGTLAIIVSIATIFLVVVLIIIIVCLYKEKKICFNKQSTDAVDNPSTSLVLHSSFPIITDQDSVDTLTINQYFIDRGTSGAIYGPFRWEDKKCALKQILYSPDKLTKEREEEIIRLRNRCKELDHPHICKMFAVWFPSPALYILMEYAEGKSLDKILRPKDATSSLQPFPLEIVKDWALQIADGMRYIHENKLVHRNLKAAHVLVMELPEVFPNTLKIGSYTLAAEHDHSTVMSLKGTMAWMAPECIGGELLSKLSDVWSYGVTVWEILTRDTPYKEVKKETDLVRAAINKTLKLNIPDSCPEPLRTLLTECLNYEVKKRPSFKQICDRFLRLPVLYEEIHVQ